MKTSSSLSKTATYSPPFQWDLRRDWAGLQLCYKAETAVQARRGKDKDGRRNWAGLWSLLHLWGNTCEVRQTSQVQRPALETGWQDRTGSSVWLPAFLVPSVFLGFLRWLHTLSGEWVGSCSYILFCFPSLTFFSLPPKKLLLLL